MINAGLIGKTNILEPYAHELLKNSGMNIIGKASVGSDDELNSFHYTIPELNKIELIERAEILVIDSSIPFPFKLMCDLVKRGKHIFCAEFPDLTFAECSELIKLVTESGAVVQICNPYYFTPAMQWLNANFKGPMFLEYTNICAPDCDNHSLLKMLLMLTYVTGLTVKKHAAFSYSDDDGNSFSSIRLEYNDASTVDLKFGQHKTREQFEIKSYANNLFSYFDFRNDVFTSNGQALDLSSFAEATEINAFIGAIEKNGQPKSTLEHYQQAYELAKKVNRKLAQFRV